jgi:hypothetical protein
MKKLCLCILVALTACSKGFSFNPYTNEMFTPNRSVAEVLVLFESPKSEYRTIGFVDYDYYQPGWASPTISEAMPSLKEKVHAVGGDAVIVRSQVAGLGMERNLRIVGDVIRFQK